MKTNLEKIRPIPKHYCEMIREVFDARILKNENYSLRAFARDLELTPGHLSEILTRKTNLSLKKGEETAAKLNFSSQDAKLFLKLIEISNASEARKKKLENELYNFDSEHIAVPNELYSSISEWNSLALLELISLKDFELDIDWIADKIFISREEANHLLSTLLKSGLIILEDGKILKQYDFFALPNGNGSVSAMNFHKRLLEKAALALDEQKSEDRNFAGAFIHIKKKDIPEISERIKKFRRELIKEFETSHDADSVYMLSNQLFRVDRPEK